MNVEVEGKVVLIVHEHELAPIRSFLSLRKLAVLTARGEVALTIALEENRPDLALVDILMKSRSGECLYQTMRRTYPEVPIVGLCRREDIKTAAKLVQKDEIYDYLVVEPVYYIDEFYLRVRRALQTQALLDRIEDLGRQIEVYRQAFHPVELKLTEAPSSKGTIMIIEDDAIGADVLTDILLEEGFNVYDVRDAHAGVGTLLASKVLPDVILMDINLPGMDGIATTTLLKSLQQTAPIPVIMITASSDQETVVRSVNAGACDFVSKPFAPKILLGKVVKMLPDRGGNGQPRDSKLRPPSSERSRSRATTAPGITSLPTVHSPLVSPVE